MKIGIVGGGQLAQMMGQVKELSHQLYVIDPTPNCPASKYVQKQFVADFKDENKIRKLANLVDVLTFEIELANSKVLREIEDSGKIVAPSPQALYTIQDKFRQKTFLQENGIPVPDFVKINSKSDLERALKEYQYPAILKATQDSYDGKGNYVIKDKKDIKKSLEEFQGKSLMLERFVEFEKEISIMAVRSLNGEIRLYSPSENIHVNSILDTTISPVILPRDIENQAREIAYETMNLFGGAGVFGIEMFVTKDGKVLINEIAPRVHNSGHHTIEACRTSQFEQHLRAISGMPLGYTDSVYNAVMCNIIGKDPNYEGKYELKINGKLPQNAFLHWYDKQEVRNGRKMGHITVLTNSIQEAHNIRNMIEIIPDL